MATIIPATTSSKPISLPGVNVSPRTKIPKKKTITGTEAEKGSTEVMFILLMDIFQQNDAAVAAPAQVSITGSNNRQMYDHALAHTLPSASVQPNEFIRHLPTIWAYAEKNRIPAI